ncbi:MAG: hypothetical protein AB1640_03540 [bacterium]
MAEDKPKGTHSESPAAGREPGGAQAFAFPDLVFKELLAVIAATIILIVWSLAMDAPLKGIADPNWTENPAKAPWYFVGLQEMLVYFDPWIAGVGIPLTIIFGLAALPYLDPNTGGAGRFAFRERKLVIPVFLFGYLLWFGLIVVGQFLRGPNWQFYWPWESWAVPKPAEPPLVSLPNSTGWLAIGAYFALGLMLPALAGRKLFRRMGILRYLVAWTLALAMFGVFAKIVLRLFFHVKYLVTTPYFSI